jgi:hypothetical protein
MWTDTAGRNCFLIASHFTFRFARQSASTRVTPLGDLDMGTYGVARFVSGDARNRDAPFSTIAFPHRFFGFAWGRRVVSFVIPFPGPTNTSYSVTHEAVLIPFWAPFAIVAWLPTARLVGAYLPRFLRLRRERRGHCPSCRYNLTGNISGVCPECGMKIAEAK